MYCCVADTRLFLSLYSGFVNIVREVLSFLFSLKNFFSFYYFSSRFYTDFHLCCGDASGPTNRRVLCERATVARVEKIRFVVVQWWLPPTQPSRVVESRFRVLDGARECRECVAATPSSDASVRWYVLWWPQWTLPPLPLLQT